MTRAPAETTDDELFIANTAFGIQKTKLSNLMDAAADGVLAIDGSELWTLKYAGEIPWGGPLSLKMHDGNLYAALGFLGIGIYDPADLTAVGAYNLYTDCTNSAQEDWFGYPKRKISCPDPVEHRPGGSADLEWRRSQWMPMACPPMFRLHMNWATRTTRPGIPGPSSKSTASTTTTHALWIW